MGGYVCSQNKIEIRTLTWAKRRTSCWASVERGKKGENW